MHLHSPQIFSSWCAVSTATLCITCLPLNSCAARLSAVRCVAQWRDCKCMVKPFEERGLQQRAGLPCSAAWVHLRSNKAGHDSKHLLDLVTYSRTNTDPLFTDSSHSYFFVVYCVHLFPFSLLFKYYCYVCRDPCRFVTDVKWRAARRSSKLCVILGRTWTVHVGIQDDGGNTWEHFAGENIWEQVLGRIFENSLLVRVFEGGLLVRVFESGLLMRIFENSLLMRIFENSLLVRIFESSLVMRIFESSLPVRIFENRLLVRIFENS